VKIENHDFVDFILNQINTIHICGNINAYNVIFQNHTFLIYDV